MTHGLMRRLAVAAAALGVLTPVGVGSAAACDGGHHDRAAASALTFAHHGGTSGLLAAVQSYLGLPADTIKDDLKNGQTLAQIADATPDKSSAGLVAALNAAAKSKLDALVAAGKLSTDQESAILSRVATVIDKLVTTSWRPEAHAFGHTHHRWHHH